MRNNSAWNHRWFVTFGRFERDTKEGQASGPTEEVYEREIAYAKDKIREAPQNASPWNYLKGVLRRQSGGTTKEYVVLKEFALEFVDLENEEEEEVVRSSHALDLLAEIWAQEVGERKRAERALELLGGKFDPIRKNYWEYRRSLLAEAEASVGVADLALR